jgi:hypothetical protein
MCDINELVGLGICDTDVSKSGFMLTQAGGMAITNFANIASETYKTGMAMVEQKKQLAILQLKNALIAELHKHNVVTQIAVTDYNSSVFNPASDKGTYAGYRGLTLHKNGNWRGGLRKTKIKKIQLYPFTSGDTTIRIQDGDRVYIYDVTVVGGVVNEFDETQLGQFPFVMDAHNVSITVDQTDIAFASGDIICHTGCNGTVPNNCAHAEGWNGISKERRESYGVNVIFYCECDYETILCSNPALFGKLLWLKWQILIYDEQYKTNRWNSLVTYSHEDIDKVIMLQLVNDYNSKWYDLMSGLKGILNAYKDSCLNCQGVRFVTNV